MYGFVWTLYQNTNAFDFHIVVYCESSFSFSPFQTQIDQYLGLVRTQVNSIMGK